jgi:ribonuclease P protein component
LINTLKKEKDFNKVFKSGKRIFSDNLTLYYLPSSETKVGFAVGKKHGKSVMRNRIKRLLRESFRSFDLKTEQNFFFILVPKVKDEYSFNEYKKDLSFMLKKLKLI